MDVSKTQRRPLFTEIVEILYIVQSVVLMSTDHNECGKLHFTEFPFMDIIICINT